jgi:UDP-N-acetylmuramoyl-tripeptide--D-alanyl-D-alanine ligase
MYQSLYSFFEQSLFWLTKQTLNRFSPTVIGVTGSVGKTSTRHAIFTVLSGFRTVRSSYANLNTELGVCLTVLGDWDHSDLDLVTRKQAAGSRKLSKVWFWIRVFFRGFSNLVLLPRDQYPEILILEYGADRPGDIKKLLTIVRPDIAVITAIGSIPVHVEFYANCDELAREKAKLIESVPASGYSILNADDDRVMGVRERTRGRVSTFGFSESASVRVTGFEHKVIDDIPVGISFKLEQKMHFVPVRMQHVYGSAHAYAAAAAAATASALGMNLVSISEKLSHYHPVDGRMNLVPGIKESLILDDSYNASPLSVLSAISTLELLPAGRKVAILGDMLELGKYSFEAHAHVGSAVARVADELITVGLRGKLIAESAQKAKMNKKNIFSFDTVEEAEPFVLEHIAAGDLVLVKGSHGIRLYELVRAIRALD